MNLGLINGSNAEQEYQLDNALNNFKNRYPLKYENLTNIRDASEKDAILLIKNEEYDISKICRSIIEIKKLCVPVWVVTKEKEIQESFVYIQLGACGVFNSNFSVEEMVMMINNTLQYNQEQITENKQLVDSRISLNAATWNLYIDGQRILLTRSEFVVVDYLYRHKDEVCTYDEIVERLLEDKSNRSVNKFLVANLVFRIREKIRKKINNKMDIIETVRSVGYMMYSTEQYN
jgi:DNA-binding response OmpR family regulator